MDQKPKYLTFYAIAILALSLWFPMKALLIAGTLNATVRQLYFMLHPLQWVTMFICWTLVALSLKATPKLKSVITILFVSVALHHLMAPQNPLSSSLSQEIWSSVALVVLQLPLFVGQTGKILRNPRLRWWLVPRRHLIEVPVHIRTLQGLIFNLRSFDLSDSGVSLQVPPQIFGAASTSASQKFFLGKRVSIRMSSERLREINLDGMIVRCKEEPHGHYPAGLGIRFVDLDMQTKSELRRLLKGHNSQPSYLRPL